MHLQVELHSQLFKRQKQKIQQVLKVSYAIRDPIYGDLRSNNVGQIKMDEQNPRGRSSGQSTTDELELVPQEAREPFGVQYCCDPDPVMKTF